MPASKTRRVPGQTIACGWCGTPITLRTTGRIPTWCSATCRHRAWEQRRAATSRRSPVEVVERVIEVEKEVRVVERVEVPVPVHPRRGEWPAMLNHLADEIDAGRVYRRDLDAVADALQAVRRSMTGAGWLPREQRDAPGPRSTSRFAPFRR